VIPVLGDSSPVEGMLMSDLSPGIKMKPALSALPGRPGVPAETQDLVAASGKGNQVLLERFDTEGVSNLILLELPVGSIGSNQVLLLSFEEGGSDSIVSEGGTLKIAQHGLPTGNLHGQVVVRTLPEVNFCRVTRCADFSSHKSRCRDPLGFGL